MTMRLADGVRTGACERQTGFRYQRPTPLLAFTVNKQEILINHHCAGFPPPRHFDGKPAFDAAATVLKYAMRQRMALKIGQKIKSGRIVFLQHEGQYGPFASADHPLRRKR
jgi:hypothetical protein